MTVQDTRGNLHGKDGRFTQKTHAPAQDLDTTAPFNIDGEDAPDTTPAAIATSRHQGDYQTALRDHQAALNTLNQLPAPGPVPNLSLDYWMTRFQKNGMVYETTNNGTSTTLTCYDKQHRRHSTKYPTELVFNQQNQLTSAAWYRHGILHRDSKPAVTRYDTDGHVTAEEWCQNGHPHRDSDQPTLVSYRDDGAPYLAEWENQNGWHRDNNQPAVIYHDDDEHTLSIGWYTDGQPRRDDGPAVVKTRDNHTIQRLSWQNGHAQHRADGPAFLGFTETGQVDTEEWWRDGQPHRDNDQPATTLYRDDGTIMKQDWFQNGHRHRDHGPALIQYWPDGRPRREEYYHDNQLTCPSGEASIIEYDRDGRIQSRTWATDTYWGYREAEDGPAIEHYTPDGDVSGCLWFNNGELFEKHEQAE